MAWIERDLKDLKVDIFVKIQSKCLLEWQMAGKTNNAEQTRQWLSPREDKGSHILMAFLTNQADVFPTKLQNTLNNVTNLLKLL